MNQSEAPEPQPLRRDDQTRQQLDALAQPPLSAEELTRMRADAAKVFGCVQNIINRRHTMCVPAQPDDFDLLLNRVADDVPALLAEVDRLRAQLQAASEAGVGAEWLSKMHGDGLPLYHREVEIWDGGTKRAFAYLDEDDDEAWWILSSNPNGDGADIDTYPYWRYASVATFMRPTATLDPACPTGCDRCGERREGQQETEGGVQS